MTSNDEIYLSYEYDPILVFCNIIHKKLDKYDEFLSSYTTPVISYHEQPSWHVAIDVVQPRSPPDPPNRQPWNYVRPVPTYGLMSAFASEPYRQQFNLHTPKPPYGQSTYQNVGYPPIPVNRPYSQQPQPPTGWPPQPRQLHQLQQHVTLWQTTAELLQQSVAVVARNTKTLFMKRKSVVNLMEQVEVRDYAAEQPKTEVAKVKKDLQNEIKEDSTLKQVYGTRWLARNLEESLDDLVEVTRVTDVEWSKSKINEMETQSLVDEHKANKERAVSHTMEILKKEQTCSFDPEGNTLLKLLFAMLFVVTWFPP